MGLIKEPKNVDFTVKSKPWTAKELKDFRELMAELKAKNSGHVVIKNKTKSSKKKKSIA